MVETLIHDELILLIKKHMETWQPGHPLDPDTTSGAIVDDIQTRNVLRYIEAGIQEGAKLLMGDSQVMEDTGGYYIVPTVFAQVDNKMAMRRE